MPTRSRTLLAVLSLVLAACVALTVDGTAVASPRPAGSRSLPAVAAGDGRALDLGSDAVVPRRDGRVVIRKWNVRTLYYYETLPAKWDWSLNTAVAKWNASGARIRFARTVSRTKAQVRIGYADIGSAAGLATVGATRNAFVHLSSRISTWDAVDARNRVTVMLVLAHELGHVLGFQHVTNPCQLMAPVIDIDTCVTVPSGLPGHYVCRTIDGPLVRRLVKTYGGTPRYAPGGWCLIDPLPPVLTGVTFSGGGDGPVTVRWTPPESVPAGSTMVLKRWETTSCGTAPGSADIFRLSMAAGVWQDDPVTHDERACFQLQLLNRYGAARPAKKQVLSRWVPPIDPPEIGTPSYDFANDQFTFTASVSGGTQLLAKWDSDHPTECVTEPNQGLNGRFLPIAGGVVTLTPPTPLPQCVSFFAYDREWQRSSEPVFTTFSEPDWPSPVMGTPTYDRVAATFATSYAIPSGAQLWARWNPTDPSTCVTGVADGSWLPSWRYTNGIATVSASGPFPRCVSFFTHGRRDRGSAATQVMLTIPELEKPAAPEIGPATWDPAVARFHSTVHYPAGTHLVFRNPTTNGGPCLGAYPGGGVPVVEDAARLGEGIGEFYALDPHACVSFYAIVDATGAASEPTQVLVDVPLPTDVPTVGAASLEPRFYPDWQTTLSTGPGGTAAHATLAGPCPAAVPTGIRWDTRTEADLWPGGDAGKVVLTSQAEGDNCALFTSLDWFGWPTPAGSGGGTTFSDRHGPVTMVTFVDEGPKPPSLGTPVWNQTSRRFEVPISDTWRLHMVYDLSDPSTCPTPGAPGTQAVTYMDPNGLRVDVTPPTPHTCVTVYTDSDYGPVTNSSGVALYLDVPDG